MAEKTSTAVKTSEPDARGARREAPPPSVLGLAGSLLDLQSSVGNRAVGRLLGRAVLQPRLRIGPAGDAYEREADRVADAVLRMPESGAAVPGAPMQSKMDAISPRVQRKESGGTETGRAAPPAQGDATAPCNPLPLPRAQYLAHAGTSSNDFGLTRMAGTVSIPAVHTNRVSGGFVLSATAAAMPPIDSVYTAAGSFREGTAVVQEGASRDCPGGRYPVLWTISAEGAERIRQGELEHCSDLLHAFAISLQRYAGIVNGLARRRQVFPSARAARARVARLAGAAPDRWAEIFTCLAHKTEDRDRMRWHDPRHSVLPPRSRTNCGHVSSLIHSGSLPHVGQHSSSEVVRDCGERGAPTPARASGARRQPRLKIGPPDDSYEREADRVADTVLRDGPTIPISAVGRGAQRMCAECEEELVQRMCAECQEEQEEEELLQHKADGTPPSTTSPSFEARLGSLRGSGRLLPADLRSFFEPRFGHDFGAVRVHTGGAADEAAQAVSARAFTVGSDVVFGAGEWSPGTTAGKRLLAHELTHVVQQTPLVARRKPLLQRAPEEIGEPPAQAEEPSVNPEETSPAPEEPAPGSPGIEGAPAPALVVDDAAETVGPGQMTRSEFFARLRTEVCAAAEAGLAGTEHSARGCPLIEFWIGYYERQGVERINRDLPRFAAEGPRPRTAEGYVALITARVRESVTVWARTGEVTGVPPGIPLPGMSLPGLGGLGGLLGGLGGLSFKARAGGPRLDDPRALSAGLGPGRPLDSTLRSRMESAFGRGFSEVRVHTDAEAARLSSGLNARAFTVGRHVAFGPGEYQPGTLIGDALIAHELAHVAQQGGATDPEGPRLSGSSVYDALEGDADMAAVGAVTSLWGGLRNRVHSLPQALPRLRSGLRLQRCPSCGTSQRPAVAPPSVVPMTQTPSQLCSATERQTHPERHCCTQRMLGEIQSYRTKAAGVVTNAVNKLQPGNVSSVSSELQAHFHLSPGDAAVNDVRRHFGDMDRALRQGQVEFRCRDQGDPGTPCQSARASSNNCSSGRGLVWLCAWYSIVADPAKDDFLDSSYLGTMIHEFSHIACTPPTRIFGVGSEIYYRSGTFPGTAAQSVRNSDCYENFAMAVR